MKYILLLFVLAVTVSGCDNTDTADKAPSSKHAVQCDPGVIKTGIQHWINSIRDYRLRADVTVKEAEITVNSHIIGVTARRLKAVLEIQQNNLQVTQTTVFDGTFQWVESKSKLGTEVVKIQLAPLTFPARPFDTSFYLMGSGLLSGEDFPATLNSLLLVYDTEAHCIEGGKLELSGRINPEAFKDYLAQSRYANPRMINMQRFVETFPHLHMLFNINDYHILGYSLGTVSDDALSFNVSELQVNQQIADAEFNYEPPEDVPIVDITDQVRNMWAQ